jgi:hypothetical protein
MGLLDSMFNCVTKGKPLIRDSGELDIGLAGAVLGGAVAAPIPIPGAANSNFKLQDVINSLSNLRCFRGRCRCGATTWQLFGNQAGYRYVARVTDFIWSV